MGVSVSVGVDCMLWVCLCLWLWTACCGCVCVCGGGLYVVCGVSVLFLMDCLQFVSVCGGRKQFAGSR